MPPKKDTTPTDPPRQPVPDPPKKFTLKLDVEFCFPAPGKPAEK
jgi:hypothetical protein